MTYPVWKQARWFCETCAPVALLWATSIVLVWLLVSMSLNQPVWQLQHSRDLARFGATRGFGFVASDAWKLIASQWLHVKFPHMLFNALVIATVGGGIERSRGWSTMLCIGLAGGVLAQFSTLMTRPEAYISGASQASLAICGLALVTFPRRTLTWWVAAIGISVSVILDVFVSSHGALKIGHIVGLGAGLIAGCLILVHDRNEPTQ